MRTVFTGKVTATMPTREDVESLKIGDIAPNCFRDNGKIVSIFGRGDDIHGKAFVCYYTQFGENGGTISHSLKEDELDRDLNVTKAHTSVEIDAIEHKFRKAQ